MTYIKLGVVRDPPFAGGIPVAAVYGGDIRHGTIGSADAPDAQWHLAQWGAFDRNMVGSYWFIIPKSWAKYKWPGLWEIYETTLMSGLPPTDEEAGEEPLHFPSRDEYDDD